MARLDFDANTVEPKQSFDPIPAGKYLVGITESEMKRTKAGDGEYLKLTIQVLEGEHKGRLLWVQLNLRNKNPKTVEIALAELSAICRAVNTMMPRDSVELHNLPMLVTVKLAKRKDSPGEFENRISKYEKREMTPGVPPQATTQGAPWRR